MMGAHDDIGEVDAGQCEGNERPQRRIIETISDGCIFAGIVSSLTWLCLSATW